MKKKLTKQQKQKKNSKEQLLLIFTGIKTFFSAHGVIVMFVVAGVSIGFALYKSSAYLNPVRDENKYQELSESLNYSKIDYKLVNRLSEALNDTEVKVDQNLNPDRLNPFSE